MYVQITYFKTEYYYNSRKCNYLCIFKNFVKGYWFLYIKCSKMRHYDIVGTLYLSSCNIYAVQQDKQSDFNEWVYSALMLARHVSDLIGPSSGGFCTSCMCRLWYVVILCVLLDTSSCICRLWYVVIRVLLDTSSRYKVVGRTAHLKHRVVHSRFNLF